MAEEDNDIETEKISPEKTLRRIEKNNSLLDILIQIEDFFDNLDLYAFRNWFDGEIVDGPYIKRYWVKLRLRWNEDAMPDPQGALRLLYHNAKVKFQKVTEKQPVEIKDPSDYRNDTHRPKKKHVDVWYAEITIPRRFIEDRADNLELYDDEVDIEDIEDAQDQGIESEHSYIEGNQEEQDEEEREQEEEDEI